MSEPGRGNTLIVPGSHLLDEVAVPNDGQSSAKGAIPICVPTGAAVIIDRRIWHSRSIKSWHQTRQILFMGYSFRWLLPKDDMTVEQLYPKSRSGPPAAPARQPEQQRHLHSRQRRHATSRLAFAALLRRRRGDADNPTGRTFPAPSRSRRSERSAITCSEDSTLEFFMTYRYLCLSGLSPCGRRVCRAAFFVTPFVTPLERKKICESRVN